MSELHSPEGNTSSIIEDSWRIFRIMAEFVEGFQVMGRIGPAVSIFGSARTPPADKYYKAAEETGRLLAEAEFAIITGGGGGIMEAGNKGAYEAGGESIGLNISLPQEQEANKYQTVGIDFHYFYARKVMFVKYAAAFVCFPGGYGTLDEFFETLTLIQTMKTRPFPVVLYGSSYWSGLLDWMKQTLPRGFTDAEDLKIYRLVDDPGEAAQLVIEGLDRPWWSPKDRELKRIAAEPGQRRPPAEADAVADTGEGTLYGRRPRPSSKRHVKAGKKPPE